MGKGMVRRYGWLVVLVVVALLATACGPQTSMLVTPQEGATEAPPTAAAVETPKTVPTEVPSAPTEGAEPPVAGDDWRTLGSPDAAVTIVEYSDFQ